MRALIRRLADEGMTVVLSSHLLAEVEELCNRVAIVRTGRIVYEGRSPSSSAPPRGATGCARPTTRARSRSAARSPGSSERARSRPARSTSRADEDAVPELSVALVEAGARSSRWRPQTATLEDLFFRLTEGDGEPPAERRRAGAVMDAA